MNGRWSRVVSLVALIEYQMAKQKKRTAKFLAKKGKGNNPKPKSKFKKKSVSTEPKKAVKKSTPVEDDAEPEGEEDDGDMDIDDFLNADILDGDDSVSELEDDDDEEDEEDSSDDEEDEEDTNMDAVPDEDEKEAMDEEKKKDSRITVTIEMLKDLEDKAFTQKSRKALGEIMRIYNSACVVKEENEDPSQASNYLIRSSVVYNRIMVTVLRNAHESLNEMGTQVEEFVEFSSKKARYLVQLFFRSTVALLKQVTDKSVQIFILRQLEPYMKFIVGFPKYADRLLYALLQSWSDVSGNSTEEDDVCMLAFLRIRDLALKMPFPFIEKCLKGIYLSYQRRAKFTNEISLRAHTLMGNCVVELYSLDLASSYQHVFIYIRQLALTIRRAIMSKTPETLKKVLNWQFCNSLKVWSAVLCAHPKTEQSAGLQALVYPLTQIIYGTIRLIPTARYFPLRFHCVSILQQLAAATNTFIPTTSILLDVLHSKELNRRARGGNTGKPTDFSVTLKLSKSALDMPSTQDALVDKTVSLLNSEIEIYQFNIGFPELIVPLTLSLRKFNSNCKVQKWTTMIKGVIQSCTKRSDRIILKRNNVEFSPKDITAMETFLDGDAAATAKERLAKSMAAAEEKAQAIVKEAEIKESKKPVQEKVEAVVKKTEEDDEDEDENEEDIVQDIEWSSDEE